MTYIEKLAEKIGVKEAMRAAFAGCPGDHFKDCENVRPGAVDCTEMGCGRCWLHEMKEGEDNV